MGKAEAKGRLRAFRIEPELDERIEARSKELNVSYSWLVRDLVRKGLSQTEAEPNGDVRKVRKVRS